MIHNEREQISGKLILPNATPTDKKTLMFGETSFNAFFGDIFTLLGEENVLVIPNYKGGKLLQIFTKMTEYNQFESDDSDEEEEETYDTFKFVSTSHGNAILYHYSNTNKLEEEFEEIATMCPAKSNLIFPTIGTNNGLSFHESAFRMFHGILACFRNNTSEFHKLASVNVVTLFNEDQANTSTRVIQHLFNYMTVYEKTEHNKICMICMDAKVDTILGCGHYAICSRCLSDLKTLGEYNCPLCKKLIEHSYLCANANHTDIFCCENPDKSVHLFIPCGHMVNICVHCWEKKCSRGTKCLACSCTGETCVKCFDS